MEQQINSQDGDNKATTNMVQTKVIIHIPYDPSLEEVHKNEKEATISLTPHQVSKLMIMGNSMSYSTKSSRVLKLYLSNDHI